jgi:putative ABC transport system permease protein
MAPALVQEFPEVLRAARINRLGGLLRAGGESLMVENGYWADPDLFDIFSLPLVRGDRAAALRNPFSVLLSERTARRLFGGADPLGQTIFLFGGTVDFKVEGVFRNIPANSHFVMDLVAPFETQARIWSGMTLSSWNRDLQFVTYILLKQGADAGALEGKLTLFAEKHGIDEAHTAKAQRKRFLLQPLTQIHLHSRANYELSANGDARLVLLFASIAVLALVVACINYMNQAVARSLKRVKEVGLRKVIGAAKGQLVRQFLGDSTMLTFIALVLAVGFVLAVLPAFRNFVGREIVFNPIRDIHLTLGLILLAVVVGAAAGCYPAFFVSAFRPASVLKGAGISRTKGKGLRNGLIVFQFAASIALTICAAGVRSQLRYVQNKDLGYGRDQIIVLSGPPQGVQNNLEAFKTELKRNPAILAVAASGNLPNRIDNRTTANWPGKSDSVQIPIYYQYADDEYVDLYGMTIVQGRNFSRDFPSDAGGAFMINETLQKALGWDEPVGRQFIHSYDGMTGKIVGVIKDFHTTSLHFPIVPLVIILPKNPNSAVDISIKIQGRNYPQTLAFIKKTWERFEPDHPFSYSFFDEILGSAYRIEHRLETIFKAFAGLAVLIACLGLVGLASFTAEQKTREIGIRKVLGASTTGIIALLSREFLKWVVLANLIAWPIGYFAMKSWLRNFAYKTSLNVSVFLGAGLAAFVIAAAVISLRTYRAAAVNPAESIRYE